MVILLLFASVCKGVELDEDSNKAEQQPACTWNADRTECDMNLPYLNDTVSGDTIQGRIARGFSNYMWMTVSPHTENNRTLCKSGGKRPSAYYSETGGLCRPHKGV